MLCIEMFCAHDSIAFKISHQPLYDLITSRDEGYCYSPVDHSESSLKIHRGAGLARNSRPQLQNVAMATTQSYQRELRGAHGKGTAA